MKMVCFCEKAHFRFFNHTSKQKPLAGMLKLKTFHYLCH